MNLLRRLIGIAILCITSLGSVPSAAQDVPATEEGKALVVFMRPSMMGFAVKSSVFDITSGSNEVIGILPAKKKIFYQSPPGERVFMIIGESADFMPAHLEAGKTYYATAQVRHGAWKARFSLLPVRAEQRESKKFQKWLKKNKPVDNHAESVEWANKHIPSIEKKRAKYWEKWEAKPEAAKGERTLFAEDGS